MFDDYRKGIITTKKEGSASHADEAKYLIDRLIEFSTYPYKEIEWDYRN